MQFLTALIVMLVLLAAGWSCRQLWEWQHSATQQIAALTGRIAALEKEAEDQKKHKEHTVSTTAAFEDALAILMRLAVEEQSQAEYRQAWINRVQEVLKMARQGPYAYPVDRPSGNGISKRRVTYTETVEPNR